MSPFVCTIRLRDYCENKLEKDDVLLHHGLQCDHQTCCRNQDFLLQEAQKLGFDCRSEIEKSQSSNLEHEKPLLKPPFESCFQIEGKDKHRSGTDTELTDCGRDDDEIKDPVSGTFSDDEEEEDYFLDNAMRHMSLESPSPQHNIDNWRVPPRTPKVDRERVTEFSTPHPVRNLVLEGTTLFSGLYSPSLTAMLKEDERELFEHDGRGGSKEERYEGMYGIEEEDEIEDGGEEAEEELDDHTRAGSGSPMAYLLSSLQRVMPSISSSKSGQ
jgi:hypothetical protein